MKMSIQEIQALIRSDHITGLELTRLVALQQRMIKKRAREEREKILSSLYTVEPSTLSKSAISKLLDIVFETTQIAVTHKAKPSKRMFVDRQKKNKPHKERIVTLTKEGKTTKEIAHILGVSTRQVSRLKHQAGLLTSKNKIDEGEVRRLISYGKKDAEIAAYLGVSQKSINNKRNKFKEKGWLDD